jgi:hypothetical protein
MFFQDHIYSNQYGAKYYQYLHVSSSISSSNSSGNSMFAGNLAAVAISTEAKIYSPQQ